ncbi:hypothetical protein V5O48_006206 [Marasmius crinis-equi]|uniref:Peroxidase n=1 Tax=Marasmius crinis-equi TaxID=585013 RepID=A0ABR3FK53_9AGAR
MLSFIWAALFKWGLLAAYTARSVAAAEQPSFQMDRLDNLLWENNFVKLTHGSCVLRNQSTLAAEWVRLAYHDMSTHNADDGTGGLDASIVFELDRAQNVGQGMIDSINDFLGFTNPGVSLADLVAMGAVLGVGSCGGPLIPYRGGRADATSAGPATVPEPQQDLASHTESFRRQGFTQSEMIALVACGHSLGGVRQQDFPEIVQTPVDRDIALFDGTQGFDNAVVTRYLQGTTTNPLAVGPNTTTNSDLRIFSSDGNATMQGLGSPDNFNKVCSDLLERMINTVPKGVQLTDVVEPIEYKVGQSRLFPGDTPGLLRFTTSLRLLHNNPSRTVKLFWSDRQGSVCPSTGCSVPSTSVSESSGSVLMAPRGLSLTIYEFDTPVNMTSSMSKFWFEVDEGDGSKPVLVNNDGAGLLIKQDAVLFDLARTSFSFEGSGLNYNVVIAARNADASTKISLVSYIPATLISQPLAKRETINLSVDSRYPLLAGYTFFSGNLPFSREWFDIVAEIGGQTIREENVQVKEL